MLAALLAVCVGAGTQAALAVAQQQSPVRVPRYGVLERSLSWKASGGNLWERVSVDVTLRAPSGRTYEVGGFYAAPDTWKFRYAPSELGAWSWTARITDGSRAATSRGSFVVVRGSSPGFVRRSPYNRFRWTFGNGAPYYPIGLNDCTQPFQSDKPLEHWGLDGDFRSGPGHQGARLVSMDEYMRAYSKAGFNLFRWGPDNCSFALYERIDPSGNVYSLSGGQYADQLFATLRRYGFRIEMVLFGFDPPFPSNAGDTQKMDAVRRYVRYVVDRYGAYVDVWELMNEAEASDAWVQNVGGYVHSIDPYRHPVGTNWSRPELSAIDFGADHWYEREDPLVSDRDTWARFQESKARSLGKPTLIDEQGNTDQNWDAGSALRMRLRAWTAFFAEGTLVFWNTSFAKDNRQPGAAANIYLGPEERAYVRVLQGFTRGFDPRARIASAPVSQGNVRSYALSGPRGYAVYLVAGADRSAAKTGVRVTVSPRRAGKATWIDPSSGRVLGSASVKPGKQTLVAPAFTTDLALEIG